MPSLTQHRRQRCFADERRAQDASTRSVVALRGSMIMMVNAALRNAREESVERYFGELYVHEFSDVAAIERRRD